MIAHRIFAISCMNKNLILKTSVSAIKHVLINPNKYPYLQKRNYANSLIAMSLPYTALYDCVAYKKELCGGYILPKK